MLKIMKTENSGKSRMWKDAPAALCEFVGVDPARKWAQCEKERDEWAALAGQYKSERDEVLKHLEEIKEYGAEEINAAVDLRQRLAAALCELDLERAWAKRLQRNAIQHSIRAENTERERDEARSQRNALAASLEYIASAGLTARHCEDEAKKMLALVFEKEDGQ